MLDRHYPSLQQLAGLQRLLIFLSNDRIYWHKISISGDTIVIKTEPPEGGFDTRIFYIYENGKVGDNDFLY